MPFRHGGINEGMSLSKAIQASNPENIITYYPQMTQIYADSNYGVSVICEKSSQRAVYRPANSRTVHLTRKSPQPSAFRTKTSGSTSYDYDGNSAWREFPPCGENNEPVSLYFTHGHFLLSVPRVPSA